MSEENVEVVRRGYELWNRRDYERFAEIFHPDVIVSAPSGWPEPGPFVGRDAAVEQFKYMQDAFDTESIEIVGEMLSAGDRVLTRVIWHVAGYGPASGMELTALSTVRQGRIVQMEHFWEHNDALEAAGLSA